MTIFQIYISVFVTVTGSFICYVFWTTNQNTLQALKTLTLDHTMTKESHQSQLTEQHGELLKHGLEILHQKELHNRTEREIKELLKGTSDRFDQVLELAMANSKHSNGK